MNRKTSRFRTLRGSSAHKHGPAGMKPGLLYPHRRRLLAALALPAAALLPASCDPPASPSPAAPSEPPPAVLKVPTISGLPNMAQIEQRLNAQYAQSAQSTQGVEFTPPRTSGTTVSAAITYADDQLLPVKIGSTEHLIKTITITREVDGKTIPTRVEYKDKPGTTRKTIISRYVPANVPTNNVQQSLEGGPRFSEAAAEGHTLHISGEEKDAADNILRTFTATERTGGGTTTLRTTYRRPDKEGFTETLTTENGIPSRKEVIYPDKEAAAQKIKTETITYEKSASAMFYPARQKLTLAVYRDAEGKETKRDEAQDDGSMLTTMRDKSTITTKSTEEGGTLAEYKDADGNTTETIETTPIENGILAVHKNPGGTVTKSIETTRTPEGGRLVVNKDAGDKETSRVETRKDGSTITTKTTAAGITKELVIHPSITAIEDNAFRNSGLTSLTMGNNLQTIGQHAFQDNELTELTIPPSVTSIWNSAFFKNKLTSLTIGNGVKTIGYGAFANNPTLKTVRITGTGAIENNAFYYYETTSSANGIFNHSGSSGIELVIEDGITSIGDTAFSLNALTSVTIPPSVTSIGEAAFRNNKLTTVVIPSSVTAIGQGAFSYNQLTSVILPEALSKASETAFNGNPAGLKFRDHKGRELGTN